MNTPGDMFALVRRNRSLRRLLVALAVSQAGDWLYNLALLVFVYDRTHSVTWTAVTTAARVLPIVLLCPFGGVLADRHDRRRLMIASDLVRVGAMVLLAVVAVAGLPVLLAPLLAAVSTAAAGAYPPCVAATLPRLVEDADLPTANAARSAIQSASIIVGPAGGGLLLLLGSPAMAFLLNAATFAASAAILLSLPGGMLFSPAGPGAKAPGVLRELRAGAVALRGSPLASRLVGADIMCSLTYGAQTVLLLLLGRRLGYGDAGYGYLLAGYGIGGVFGAGLASRLSAARNPRYAVGAVLLAVAVPSTMLAVTPYLTIAIVFAVAIGAGSVMVEVVADTALARALDEAVLARAYGLAYPASIGGIVAGSLVASPLVTLVGLSAALAVVGGAVAAYALFLCLPAAAWRRPPHHSAIADPANAPAV
ncbi:MAG TPA: MFS transporter [Streptosporangiaceae bacterium]|nr:MFS transporter [Streptosporangiaceae bacterium]